MFKFLRALWRLPAWMDAQTGYLNSIAVRNDTTGRDIAGLKSALSQMNGVIREAVAQQKSIVEQQDRLRAFVDAMEGAGIRRKFGGRIDVEFDRFVNSLSPSDVDELLAILKARQAQKAKRTPREMTIDGDPAEVLALPK